jgi:uncharacterized membrane protein
MSGDQSSSTSFRIDRLAAFSDGVFAIAITVLVLEISVPVGSEEHLLRAVLDQWPAYLAYIVSFATIGAIWVGHSGITEYLDHADPWFLRLNLLLLLVVAFLPFPTRLLGESVKHVNAGKVATVLYGLVLLLAVALLGVVWRYAVREHLVRTDVTYEKVADITRKVAPGLAGYVVMIVLGFFFPVPAVLGYFALAVFYLVPFGNLPFRNLRGGR